jgi:hypothetical protein
MKFDNYVYLTICEESLKLYKKTHFSTYTNYCKTFHLSMVNGDFTARETSNLLKLFDVLNLIYGLNDSESFKYILDFFGSDKIREFEMYVVEMGRCFPMAFN